MAGKQRKSLVKGVAKGEQNTQRLNSAHQMASNTADVGDEILKSLHNQREKIVSARVAAEGMEGDMDTSERKMRRMECEKCVQRWILWVIAGMFVIGLCFFLYWKMAIEPEKQRNCQRDQDGRCASYSHGSHERYDPDNDYHPKHWAALATGEDGVRVKDGVKDGQGARRAGYPRRAGGPGRDEDLDARTHARYRAATW